MGLKKTAKHDPYTLGFVDENTLISNAEVVSIINKPILYKKKLDWGAQATWQTLTFTDDYRTPRPENVALGIAGDAVVLHGAQYPPGLYQGQRAPLLNFTDGTQRRPLAGHLTVPQGRAVLDPYILVEPTNIDPIRHHVDFWAANGRPLTAGALLAGDDIETPDLALHLGDRNTLAILMQIQPLRWEIPLRVDVVGADETVTFTLNNMYATITAGNVAKLQEHRIAQYPFILRIYCSVDEVRFEVGDFADAVSVTPGAYTSLRATGAYYIVSLITLSDDKTIAIWPYNNHDTKANLYAWYPLHALHTSNIAGNDDNLEVTKFAIEAPEESFNTIVGVMNPAMADNHDVHVDGYPFIFDALYPITESQPYKLHFYDTPVDTQRGAVGAYTGTVDATPGGTTELPHAFIDAETLVIEDANGNTVDDYTLDRIRGVITWGTSVTEGTYDISYNYYAWEFGFDSECNRVYLGNNANESLEITIASLTATNGLYGYLHLYKTIGEWPKYGFVYDNADVTAFAHPTSNGGFWTFKHHCYASDPRNLVIKNTHDISKTIIWLDYYQFSNGEPVCSLTEDGLVYYDGTTQQTTYNAVATAAMPLLLRVTYADTQAAGLAVLGGFDNGDWYYFDTKHHAATLAKDEEDVPIRNVIPYRGRIYGAAGAKILAVTSWDTNGAHWETVCELPATILALDSDENYIYAATTKGIYQTDLTASHNVKKTVGCRLNVRGQRMLISEHRLYSFTRRWGIQQQRLLRRAAPADVQQKVGIAPTENGILWANGYHTFLKTEAYFEDFIYDCVNSRAIETSRDGVIYTLQGDLIHNTAGHTVYMGPVKDIHWVAFEDALEVVSPDGVYFLDKTTLKNKKERDPILFAVPVDALYVNGLLYVLYHDKLAVHNSTALLGPPLATIELPLQGHDTAIRLMHVVYNHHPALIICARHSLYHIWLEDPQYNLHTLIPYHTQRYCAACGAAVEPTDPPLTDKDTNYYECPNCGVIPESQTLLLTSENINAYPILPNEPVVIGLPFWAPFILEGVIGCNANDNQVYIVTRKRVIQYSWALPTP